MSRLAVVSFPSLVVFKQQADERVSVYTGGAEAGGRAQASGNPRSPPRGSGPPVLPALPGPARPPPFCDGLGGRRSLSGPRPLHSIIWEKAMAAATWSNHPDGKGGRRRDRYLLVITDGEPHIDAAHGARLALALGLGLPSPRSWHACRLPTGSECLPAARLLSRAIRGKEGHRRQSGRPSLRVHAAPDGAASER